MPETQIVDVLARSLLHFVWQGATIAALLAIVLVGIGDRPALRHAAASVALVASLVVFATTLAHEGRGATPVAWSPNSSQPTSELAPGVDSLSGGASAAERELAAQRATTSGRTSRPVAAAIDTTRTAVLAALDAVQTRHAPVIAGAWALGVLMFALRLAGGAVTVRRLRTRGVRAVPASVQASFDTLRSALGVAHGVAVKVSSQIDVPVVIGVVRPLVLLPLAAIGGMPVRQLECMLAHELAHLRRGDQLINVLQRGAEVILFFHPAIWWMSAVATREREHAADELALAATGGDRGIYAAALVNVATTARARALALHASDGDLVRRVRRVLAPQPRPAFGPAAMIVMAALTLGLSAAALTSRAEATPAPTATLWATVTPGVLSADDGSRWIVPPGNFAALEERVDGALVRRVVIAHGQAAADVPALPYGVRRSSRPAEDVMYWIQDGPALEVADVSVASVAAAIEWFDETLLDLLGSVGDGSAGTVKRDVDQQGRLVSVYVGYGATGSALTHLQRSIGAWRANPTTAVFGPFGDLADVRSAVALAAHALAYRIDDERRVSSFLLDVLRVVDTVAPELAADVLRIVPALTDDRLKGDLVDAVAVWQGTLHPEVMDAFGAAVEAIDDPHIADRAGRAFDAGFDHLWPPDLAPVWVAAGTATTDRPHWPEVGTYYAIRRSGYVGTMGPTPFVVRTGGGNPAWRDVLGTNMPDRFRTSAATPQAVSFTFAATILDQVHEVAVAVDPSARLPIVDDVAVTGTLTHPVAAWTPVAGATHYELVVRGSDESWWLFTSTAPRFDLQAEAREHGAVMQPGSYEIVTVSAFTAAPDACPACQVNVSSRWTGLPSFEIR